MGFRLYMMVNPQAEPANESPDEVRVERNTFLAVINLVGDLQNNEPYYPWPSPLAQHLFGKGL